MISKFSLYHDGNLQSPWGEKVRDLILKQAVVTGSKTVLKKNKNDLLEITKDLLQQSYRSIPMATPPQAWLELATRVAADEPRRSNYRGC